MASMRTYHFRAAFISATKVKHLLATALNMCVCLSHYPNFAVFVLFSFFTLSAAVQLCGYHIEGIILDKHIDCFVSHLPVIHVLWGKSIVAPCLPSAGDFC